MTSLDCVRDVAFSLYDAVDSEVSRTCSALLKSDDLKGLFSLRIDPSSYSNPTLFKWDYACVEFLRKCNVPVEGVDRKEAALTSFWESERQCFKTNRTFGDWNAGMVPSNQLPLQNRLMAARGFIKRVLGPIPTNLNGRFGPGATYSLPASRAVIPEKIFSRLDTTLEGKNFLPLLEGSCLWDANRRDDSLEPLVVRGNRFTSVPKDGLKERGICIEPGLNLYFQLGVGEYIRRRLLTRAGLDLNHGQDVHRSWAREGSLTGSLATIDLSSASDTVALELVRWILPEDWFDLLFALRSPYTKINEKWVLLEKFSSMGNGFTFELETLIFAAIVYAAGAGVPGKDFLVYGDDIIIPTRAYRDCLAALSFCGFSPNTRKSFGDGPFRESCGGDFFNGVAVRPHYLKEIPYGPEDWISLANGLHRLGCSDPGDDIRSSRAYRAWKRCLARIPNHIRRCRGPVSLGDLVITDTKENWSCWTKDWIRYFRVYRPVQKTRPLSKWPPRTQLASILYGVSSRGVSPRNNVSGYKIDKQPFS